MVNVLELVNYLLYLDREKSKLDGEDASPDITLLKLQKLLYYCQGYSLGLFGEPLFEESIEAWEHGPVVVSVYNRYRSIGSLRISFEEKVEPKIDEHAKKIAQIVMQDKGRFSGWALRDMTHKEKPWNYTYYNLGRNSVIKETIIQEFFTSTFDLELSPEDEEAMFIDAGTSPTPQEWCEINRHVSSI